MKNKKIIILCITAIVLIISGLLYFSYGFYLTNITGTENSKKLLSLTKVFKFEFSDGTEKLVSNNTNFIPGSVIEKTFTITNKSTEGIYFNIDLDEVTNTFTRTSDIVYEIYYNNEIISSNTFPTTNSSIATNLYIEKDGVREYTLKVKYLNSEENQISDMGKSISANISFSRTDSPITKFNVLGNSYQEVKKGINLLKEKENFTETKNGVTCTLNSDGTYTLSGTSTAPTDFVIVGNYGYGTNEIEVKKGKYYRVSQKIFLGTATKSVLITAGSLIGETKTYNWVTDKTDAMTPSQDGYITQVIIYVSSGTTFNNYKIGAQIEEVSSSKTSATEWEAYGTKLKPSPDNPSEIKSLGTLITDSNDKNYDKYMINITPGKNLINFDISKASSGYYFDSSGEASSANKTFIKYEPVSVKPNSTYTLSSNLRIYTIWYYNNNNVITRIVAQNNSKTFKTPFDCNRIRISLYNTSGNTDTVALEWLQLEVGSTATSYEPYIEPVNYDVYLNEPLRCVGDTCDYIDLVNKKVVRNIGTITLKGTESWFLGGSGTNVINQRYFLQDNTLLSNGRLLTNILPEIYPGKTTIFSRDEQGSNVSNGIYFQLKINKEYLTNLNYETTVAGFKKYLSDLYSNNKPVIINYVLNTSTEENISLPDVSAFNGKTLIVSDGNLYSSKIEKE